LERANENQILLFALASVLAFGGASATLAQENDEYAECTQLLNSPPLDTLLTQNDGNDYGDIASDREGAALLGGKCSRDQIVEYFLSAGWEFIGENHRQSYSESGPSSDRYKTDFSIAFCLPRKLPWRLIFYRCEAIGGFSMFEERITHINEGFNE
jgi:hypothetical protein